MGTQWIPVTRFEPKSWLLANGDVISEPALEQTSTGRKIRVVGTTASVFANDLDELLGKAASAVAAERGTKLWLDLSTPIKDTLAAAAGYDPDATKCKLHLIHDAANRSGRSVAWWRFKDSNTPFEALLTVALQASSTHTLPGRQVLNVALTLPGRSYHNDACHSVTMSVTGDRFQQHLAHLTNFQDDGYNTWYNKWTEFVRDNDPNWPTEHLGNTEHAHPRLAVIKTLEVMRAFENLDSIQVPDLSDPKDVRWRDLELYDTNVNAQFINDLTEYLDGTPSIEQAADLYQQLLETLRTVGINVAGKSHNDFLAALLAGDKTVLNMEVMALAEENHRVDTDHKLSVNLPTGALIVECTHKNVDKDVVAEKWEEARMIASLTGTEDELLAYARKYAERDNSRRTSKILNEHGV